MKKKYNPEGYRAIFAKEHTNIREKLLELIISGNQKNLEKKVNITNKKGKIGHCYYSKCPTNDSDLPQDIIVLEFLNKDITNLKILSFHLPCYRDFLIKSEASATKKLICTHLMYLGEGNNPLYGDFLNN